MLAGDREDRRGFELAAVDSVSQRCPFMVPSTPPVSARLMVCPSSSIPCQSNDHDDNRVSPPSEAAPSTSPLRSGKLRSKSTKPTTSPRRPEPRPPLAVAGVSPESRRRPPSGHCRQGEHLPSSSSLRSGSSGQIRAWTGPRPSQHARGPRPIIACHVAAQSARGSAPQSTLDSN